MSSADSLDREENSMEVRTCISKPHAIFIFYLARASIERVSSDRRGRPQLDIQQLVTWPQQVSRNSFTPKIYSTNPDSVSPMQPLGGAISSNSLTAQARIHLSNDPAKRTNILPLSTGGNRPKHVSRSNIVGKYALAIIRSSGQYESIDKSSSRFGLMAGKATHGLLPSLQASHNLRRAGLGRRLTM